MSSKNKALLFNFLCFAVLFLIVRLLLGYFVPINRIFLSIISAVGATLLAPKFGSVKTEDGEKIMMKWIFLKGFRQL